MTAATYVRGTQVKRLLSSWLARLWLPVTIALDTVTRRLLVTGWWSGILLPVQPGVRAGGLRLRLPMGHSRMGPWEVASCQAKLLAVVSEQSRMKARVRLVAALETERSMQNLRGAELHVPAAAEACVALSRRFRDRLSDRCFAVPQAVKHLL